MIPGSYDLCIYRGDTGRWRFQVWQDAAKTVPADLAGAVARAQIRNAPGAGTPVDMACVVTAPNIIDMTLAPGTTSPPRGVWDLEVEYPGGDIVTVLAGKVMTQPDVTVAP